MLAASGWRTVDLLQPAHVAHLPVALRAVRVRVVAGHALGPHHHRRDEAEAPVDQRARHFLDPRRRIAAQRRQRRALEAVERVRRATGERVVREEPVADVALPGADQLAELERERGRDRDGARHLGVVVDDPRRRGPGLHAPHDVVRVVVAHLVDDPARLPRLCPQLAVRHVPQVEPQGERQPADHHEQQQDRHDGPRRPAVAGAGSGPIGAHRTGIGPRPARRNPASAAVTARGCEERHRRGSCPWLMSSGRNAGFLPVPDRAEIESGHVERSCTLAGDGQGR